MDRSSPPDQHLVLVAMNSSAALPFPALVAAGLGLLIGGLKLSNPLQLQRQQGSRRGDHGLEPWAACALAQPSMAMGTQ